MKANRGVGIIGWVLAAGLLVFGRPADAALIDSVVKIVNLDKSGGMSTGTGFVISEDGVVLTNNHVTANAGALFVVFGDNAYLPAKVLWESSVRDLAAVSVDGLKLPALTLSAGEIQQERIVRAFGYPGVVDTFKFDGPPPKTEDEAIAFIRRYLQHKEPVTITQGTVSNVTTRTWGLQDDTPATVVMHTAAIHHGNSGGPLMDSCDRVVGINTRLGDVTKLDVTKDDQGKIVAEGQAVILFFALHVKEVIKLLDAKGMRYHTKGGDCNDNKQGGGGFVLYAGVGGAVVLGGLALLMVMRRPREQVVHVTESYSQWIRRKGGPSQPSPAPASGPRWVLSGQGVTLKIDGARAASGLVLGRSAAEGSDLVIDSPKVSRRHARLVAKGGKLFIEDLKSANGTIVAGHRLSPGQPVELPDGASVVLADVTLKLTRS